MSLCPSSGVRSVTSTDKSHHPPWHSRLLHDVGGGHVVAPHVVLPLLQSNNPTEDVAGVDAYPHVHLNTGALSDPPHGGDHGQSHPDHIDRVVGSGHGQAGHTVVAVAQDLDPQALVVTGKLVKLTADIKHQSQPQTTRTFGGRMQGVYTALYPSSLNHSG